MEFFLLAIHVLAAVSIIGLVLLQQGKGADMGASFGTGSAGSVFGAAGSANFLSRSTAVAAAVFFVTSVALTYVGSHKGALGGGGVMQGQSVVPQTETPAKTDAASAASAAPKTDVPAASTPAPAAATPAVPAAPAAGSRNSVAAPSAAKAAPAAPAVPAPAKSDVPK